MSSLPLLLPPETLRQELGSAGVLLVDLCQERTWLRGHLPGAVHLPPGALVCGIPPATGKPPPLVDLQAALEQIGLRPEHQVVAYDDEGGGWAGRLLWTLDLLGHERVSLLDGGLAAWMQLGLPLTTEVDKVEPSHYPLPSQLNEGVLADRAYIEQRLDDDELVIWDARSPEEFSGQRLHARRGGHIPGARNYEWTRAMDRSRGLRMREPETIRAELAELGIGPEREIITHCQTHHRSGFTYFVGRVLGFPRLRAYPGSWSEWGNLADTPIET